jgi:hypothetical protein
MVTARPAELTRDSRSERPLPADLGEPATMPAASSLGHAYGMHASRRQQQACVWNAAAGGMCTFVAMVIVRSDRGHRPERLPLAACSRCSGCILHLCRPEGAGTSVGDRGSTVESHVARLFKFVPPMCSVRSRTGQWACPATRAASCSAADGGQHYRVRLHRFDYACPFACDRSPSE